MLLILKKIQGYVNFVLLSGSHFCREYGTGWYSIKNIKFIYCLKLFHECFIEKITQRLFFLHTDQQEMFTEDELNDCGLRKTKYAEQLYMKKKLEQNLQSLEKVSLSPTESPEDRMYNDFFTSKPKETPLKQKEKSFSTQSEKSIGSPRQNRVNVRKENSFVDQKPPSRAQSVERKPDLQKCPMKSPAPVKKNESKINTWNGRSKNMRPSLTAETYVTPFARNSTGKKHVVNYLLYFTYYSA